MQRRYTIGADSIWISDGVELGDRNRVRQVVCSTGKKKKENILYSSNARQTGGEASIPQVYKLKVLKGGDRRARGCAV